MKSFKPLLSGLITVALVATAARADVTVRLTGSTAFRNATVQGIENILGGAGNFKAAYQASSATTNGEQSATNSIYQGSVSGVSGTVTFVCSFAGSAGGVKTLTQNLTLTTWMDTSNLPGTNTVVNVASPTFDPTARTADIAMSDSRQAATPFTSPVLTADKVGVITFVWAKNMGAPTTITNMTALLARALLAGGAQLSQFSGNSADTTAVFAVGRDQDSGTRIVAFSDSGFGALTSPLQFRLNSSGGAITTVETYPANTVLGTTYPIGTSGYSGGGNVKDALNLTGSSTANVYDTTAGTVGDPNALIATGAYFIGYLGTSDAAKLATVNFNTSTGVFTANGVAGTDMQVLSYNGVPFSFTAVQEGQYSMWNYEFLMHRSSLTGDGLTVSNTLRDNIKNTAAAQVGQVSLSSMHVSRTIEGGVITHN